MESQFQTSFIPKKPAGGNIQVSKEPISIFNILSTVIFIVVSLLAIGLFFYKNYLIKQKEEISTSLLKGKERFEKDTILELEMFDKRLKNAKEILSKHISVSALMKEIGLLTIPYIQYTDFQYETNNNSLVVKLSGKSNSYKNIALQSDVFSGPKNKYFRDVIFSNIIREKNGLVGFDVSFIVDPSLVSYDKNILINN